MTPVLSPIAVAVSDATRPKLRPYQQELKDAIYQEWSLKPQSNVLGVLATGAGKTVLLSSIVTDEPGAVCVIAHRKELVSQISLALARNKVRHRVVGPSKVIKDVVRIHMEEVGRSYYDPNSKIAVAGIDTLILREEQLKDWLPAVKLWILDEAHHLLKNNKWGKGVMMFPNARGLGLTATPCRADGNGLGRHADGLFDSMKIGVTMRFLIDSGYLTQYRIFAPPSTFDRDSIEVSKSTGDLNLDQMRKAVAGSSLVVHDEKTITGDVVTQYLKIAKGKLGITFVPDINTAEAVAQQFRDAGISAAVVSSKTPDVERFALMRKFKNREILQLVNVDLFGEGVDVPVNEVISMARPTESYSLYAQQFGRPLRLSPGKTHAIIIDHVGNVLRHGLPDAPREWSLDRRERRTGKSEPSTVRVCTACAAVYERFLDACPDCGEPVPKPADRSGPMQVDGDLYELDPDVLAQMRNEVVGARETPEAMRDRLTAQHVPMPGVMSNVKRQRERLEVLGQLDGLMATIAGYWRHGGMSDKEIFRKFFLTYRTDWLSAQSLKKDDATVLMEKIQNDIDGLVKDGL
ncbi:DNA helicase [Klebsiella phage VLCpiM12a]|uniref:DNA helicase n=1 Tax=Klebsiella phage VLCpiM12a TaxID=2874879 RepID=UPI00232E34CD|nr:DNA helicase [Klebsiella phage VLCpiM12a]UVX31520.1 DNA helicase [Klebsiella phage VLCpiM12a]